MSSPTRSPNGFATNYPWEAFGFLPIPSPDKLHIDFTDFNVYAAGDWTVTETDAGATEALTDGDGGQLLITNTAADNDIVVLRRVKEAFVVRAGKKSWFACRFKTSEATQADLAIGLHVDDASPVASAPSDGIYFRKDDGDANIDLSVMIDAAEATVATALGTLVADTMVTVAWYFDGAATVRGYIDGVQVCTLTLSAANLAALDDETLTMSFAHQEGEAVAHTATIDFWFAANERP